MGERDGGDATESPLRLRESPDVVRREAVPGDVCGCWGVWAGKKKVPGETGEGKGTGWAGWHCCKGGVRRWGGQPR